MKWRATGFRGFVLVWAGELASQLGCAVTIFAAGLWIYELTGSVTRFAVVQLAAVIPTIALSPLAGAIADRWDRRRLMMLSNLGIAACVVLMAILFWTASLTPLLIYASVLLATSCSVFHVPAYTSMSTQLVPKAWLGRSSAMMQFAQGCTHVLALVLGVFLLGAVQLGGALVANLIGVLLATCALALVRTPPLPRDLDRGAGEQDTLIAQARAGWAYLRGEPGLMRLLALFATTGFLVSVASIAATPLILSFASREALGTVLSIGSSGFVLAALVLAATGGPRRRVPWLVAAQLLCGICIVIFGLSRALPLSVAAIFVFFATYAVSSGVSQALWQSHVPQAIQGRVFALRNMVLSATLPAALMVAGPMADHVFEPLLLEGGALVHGIGASLFGVGQGRGVALLCSLIGLLAMGAALLAMTSPHVYRLDAAQRSHSALPKHPNPKHPNQVSLEGSSPQ